MSKKNIEIILLLIFCLLPIHNIYAQNSNSDQTIKKIIGNNTPDFIAKPIILTVDAIERFRTDASLTSENNKKEIETQIKVSKETNIFLKYIKYIELFFITFLFFIFNNAFTFYWSLVVIIFIIIRYAWNLIF